MRHQATSQRAFWSFFGYVVSVLRGFPEIVACGGIGRVGGVPRETCRRMRLRYKR